MKYCFNSRLENTDRGYIMHLPFNVWEVCKFRDEIPGRIYLNDSTEAIPCTLLPKDKGNYEIRLADEDAQNIDLTVEHKVLLHINGTLEIIEKKSAYSLEHPIRKIDSVNLLIQPEDGLCGQACVAMLAGVTLKEAMEEMGCREWQATMGKVISALNYYGIDHSDVIMYTEGRDAKLPKCCIMMEKMGRFCHYLIHYDGKFYDSNLGVLAEYDMSKLLGYLEVKC